MDIVLLKSEIEESSLEKYTTTKPKGIKRTDLEGVERRRKTSGFGNATQMGTNSKVGTGVGVVLDVILDHVISPIVLHMWQSDLSS